MRRLALVFAFISIVLLAWAGCGPTAITNKCEAGATCACSTSGTCTEKCDGADCSFFCTSSGTCNFECEGGNCTANCAGSGTCNLDCPGGGCTLDCNGSGTCNLQNCSDCTLNCNSTSATCNEG